MWQTRPLSFLLSQPATHTVGIHPWSAVEASHPELVAVDVCMHALGSVVGRRIQSASSQGRWFEGGRLARGSED